MLFSKAGEYAVRSMLYIGAYADNGPVTVREVARDLDLPFASLAKIIQTLCRAKLLASYKGPGGGVTLARSADSITLREVVEVIDGPDISKECVLGIPGCSERTIHCPLHDSWSRIREEIQGMLGDRTLASFAKDLRGPGFVLTRRDSDSEDV